MKNTLPKILVVLAAVLLIFAVLAGGILKIFTDKVWVEKEYVRLDIESQTGWSAHSCAYVLGAMMDYSIGRRDTLEDVPAVSGNGGAVGLRFFNESELSHMVDVRKLTRTVLTLGLVALIVGFALFTVGFIMGKKSALIAFSKAFIIALGVLVVVLIVLGIWMAIDFDSFWRMFHVVFLDLESSTFDPAVSNMIRICPAELFSDFIKHFALIVGIPLAIMLGLAIFIAVFLGKKPDFSGAGLFRLLSASLAVCCILSFFFSGSIVFLFVQLAAVIALAAFSIKAERGEKA